MTNFNSFFDGPSTAEYISDPEQQIIRDLEPLFRAYTPEAMRYDRVTLLDFAKDKLDFRAGRPREDTDWSEGPALSEEQKGAILDIAEGWNMLSSSLPLRPFDVVVVLGAHKPSLELRLNHALAIRNSYNPDAELVMLTCSRPIHPKEGVKPGSIETEADLALALLEAAHRDSLKVEHVSSWQDLEIGKERPEDKLATAYIGEIATKRVVILSGSVPPGADRASTESTLQTLDTYLEESQSRILFVTTSVHLPYQKSLIDKALEERAYEIVGASYPSLEDLTLDSPDAKFRVILQEIGAAVKNTVSQRAVDYEEPLDTIDPDYSSL